MENKSINWYPGHMFKAKKEVQAAFKSVDAFIEVADARCPISSHNKMLEEITKNKFKLIILSKADLVEKSKLQKFINYYQRLGIEVLPLNVHQNSTKKVVTKKLMDINEDILEKFTSKGINKTLRIMIIGMPNVGKSSLINSLSPKKKVIVGNRPGVTKAQQVIKITDNIELVDTPGILIPKIHRLESGYNLVLNSLIKDEVVEIQDIAFYLLKYLITNQKEELLKRYSYLKENDNWDVEDIYNIENIYTLIAQSTGLYNKRTDVDYEKVSRRLINDYRNQKFGKLILDEIEYAS